MNIAALAWRDDPWDVVRDVRRFSKTMPAAPPRIPTSEISQPTTSSEPLWLLPTLTQFQRLLTLQDDWDQRGSAEVRHDVLSFALRNVLPEIMPPTAPAPAVIPLGHGGIQLVWNTDRAEIEIEVIAPNEIIAYHLDKTAGEESEKPLTNDFSSLADLMWLTFRA
jgi:hypothetical protein